MVFIDFIESETNRAVLLWEHYWACRGVDF
jgi:hypothetical protein